MRTRLNGNHRDMLLGLARKLITAPVETAALAAAYDAALPPILAAVEARYPTKDMKVLKRYDLTTSDSCLRLKTDGSTIIRFVLADGLTVPNKSCESRIYLVERSAFEAVEAWIEAEVAANDAKHAKFRDYSGLITASRFFEDVVEVWAEAEQLRGAICGRSTAVSILSPDLVSRIRNDVANRAA